MVEQLTIRVLDGDDDDVEILTWAIQSATQYNRRAVLEAFKKPNLEEIHRKKLQKAEVITNDYFLRKLRSLGVSPDRIAALQPVLYEDTSEDGSFGHFQPNTQGIHVRFDPREDSILIAAIAAAHEKSHALTNYRFDGWVSPDRKNDLVASIGLSKHDDYGTVHCIALEEGLAILDQNDCFNLFGSAVFAHELKIQREALQKSSIKAAIADLVRNGYGPLPKIRVLPYVSIQKRPLLRLPIIGISLGETEAFSLYRTTIKRTRLIEELCFVIGHHIAQENDTEWPEEQKMKWGRDFLDYHRYRDPTPAHDKIREIFGQSDAEVIFKTNDRENFIDEAMQVVLNKKRKLQ